MRDIRILLADRNALFRAGLRLILEARRGFRVAGEAPDVEDLFAHPGWDVLILDLDVPGRDGLKLLRDLRGWIDGRAVLALSSRSLEVRSLRAGADVFVSKASRPIDLLRAIERLSLAGRRRG